MALPPAPFLLRSLLSALAIAAAPLGLLASLACSTTDERPAGPSHDEAAEQYAEARCAAIESCSCDGTFASHDECIAYFEQRILTVLDQFAGATLVASCWDDALDSLDDVGCGLEAPPATCSLVRGTRQEGEPCRVGGELGFYAHDCSGFSFCFVDTFDEAGASGTCISPQSLTILDRGEPCGPGIAGFCDTDLELYCSNSTGVCEQQVALGQPCEQIEACQDLGVRTCHEGVCIVLPTTGEACTESPGCRLDCSDGSCRASPCEGGTCQMPGALVCQTPVG